MDEWMERASERAIEGRRRRRKKKKKKKKKKGVRGKG